jgi:hypothetical protein
MGLLNTIETLIAVMEDHEDVLTQLEPVALQVFNAWCQLFLVCP